MTNKNQVFTKLPQSQSKFGKGSMFPGVGNLATQKSEAPKSFIPQTPRVTQNKGSGGK